MFEKKFNNKEEANAAGFTEWKKGNNKYDYYQNDKGQTARVPDNHEEEQRKERFYAGLNVNPKQRKGDPYNSGGGCE